MKFQFTRWELLFSNNQQVKIITVKKFSKFLLTNNNSFYNLKKPVIFLQIISRICANDEQLFFNTMSFPCLRHFIVWIYTARVTIWQTSKTIGVFFSIMDFQLTFTCSRLSEFTDKLHRTFQSVLSWITLSECWSDCLRDCYSFTIQLFCVFNDL